ncbi:MAG: hypothetical protein M3O09_01025 [Acidobacteriota bacterium]|nr:hypothetical protein [Acidobacteriota bacterium]
MWFELDWVKVLAAKNKELTKQGRPLLSRYHAADCSSRVNEFAGWTTPEQIDFTKSLIGVFRKHQINTVAYSLNLRELGQEIPESADDPKKYAYKLLLRFLMLEIGENQLKPIKNSLVGIIHDRCAYDGALLETFNLALVDPTFEYSTRFTTIASMAWQDCVPLQPADLVAYENFKEAERHILSRDRRKSLSSILDLDSFGGRARCFRREGIREVKAIIETAAPQVV